MRSKGRDSRGSRCSRMPQSDARGSAGAHNQPARGRGQMERSHGSSACPASPRRGDDSSSRRSARGRSPNKRSGVPRKNRGGRKEPSSYEIYHLQGARKDFRQNPLSFHSLRVRRVAVPHRLSQLFPGPKQEAQAQQEEVGKAGAGPPVSFPPVSSEQEVAPSRPEPTSYHDVEPLALPEVFAGEGRTDRPRMRPEHTPSPTITRTVTLGSPQDPYRRIVQRSPRFQRGRPLVLPIQFPIQRGLRLKRLTVHLYRCLWLPHRWTLGRGQVAVISLL